jgi:hypothetical protein
MAPCSVRTRDEAICRAMQVLNSGHDMRGVFKDGELMYAALQVLSSYKPN